MQQNTRLKSLFILRDYVGGSMTVTGSVIDVFHVGDAAETVRVQIQQSELPTRIILLFADFDGTVHEKRLLELRKGEAVTVRGEIADVSPVTGVRLKSCELVTPDADTNAIPE